MIIKINIYKSLKYLNYGGENIFFINNIVFLLKKIIQDG